MAQRAAARSNDHHEKDLIGRWAMGRQALREAVA